MALQMDRTDPRTQAVYHGAYGRIDKAYGVLENGLVEATVNWYFSAAAATPDADGKFAAPVTEPDIVRLTDAEAAVFRQMALTGLYQILAARPEYAGAVQV